METSTIRYRGICGDLREPDIGNDEYVLGANIFAIASVDLHRSRVVRTSNGAGAYRIIVYVDLQSVVDQLDTEVVLHVEGEVLRVIASETEVRCVFHAYPDLGHGGGRVDVEPGIRRLVEWKRTSKSDQVRQNVADLLVDKVE